MKLRIQKGQSSWDIAEWHAAKEATEKNKAVEAHWTGVSFYGTLEQAAVALLERTIRERCTVNAAETREILEAIREAKSEVVEEVKRLQEAV